MLSGRIKAGIKIISVKMMTAELNRARNKLVCIPQETISCCRYSYKINTRYIYSLPTSEEGLNIVC